MDRWLIKAKSTANIIEQGENLLVANSPKLLLDEENLDNCDGNETSDSSASNSNSRMPATKRKYDPVFRDMWKDAYEWLAEDKSMKQGKKCTICNTPIVGGKTHIERHASSEIHKKLAKSAKKTIKIDHVFDKKVKAVIDEAKKLEISLSLFVAEHNLPFSVLNHLNLLLKNSIVDSQIVKNMNLNRLKGQQIITEIIAPESIKIISEVTNRQYYSLIIDESTDSTMSKNLALVVRIFDNKCKDMFLKLTPVIDSTATGIFRTMVKVLEENHIPLKNLIAFTADNCNVMMGKHNGVQAQLKALVPKLIVNGCICHNINLISMTAASQLPITIDKLLEEVNHHFCNSPTRRANFIKFQQYFGTEIHQILKYASTRWLSRQAAIDRILEQWEPLLYYFEVGSFESAYGNENIEFISYNLKNKLIRLYFLFLSYALDLINKINKEMQSEEAKMHIFMLRMKHLFYQFARNFIKKDALDNSCISTIDLNEHNLPLEKIYCGTKAELYYTREDIEQQDLIEFRTKVKNFYKCFCEDLRKRINFNDEILNLLPLFSPENVISGETSSILPVILKVFNQNEIEKIEEINSEYRALADYSEIKKFRNFSIEEFWANIGSIRNELKDPMFPNIYRIVQGILSIPHSSANVERIFSIQNSIKTKCRNRLHVNTCSALIQSKDLIKNDSCHSYTISNNLLKKNCQTVKLRKKNC